MTWKHAAVVISVVVMTFLFAFGVLVWPTAYHFQTVRQNTGTMKQPVYEDAIHRINRLTGTETRIFPRRPIDFIKRDVTDLVRSSVDVRLHGANAWGGIDGTIYNGSQIPIHSVILNVSSESGWTREYAASVYAAPLSSAFFSFDPQERDCKVSNFTVEKLFTID
jgi:hypothetical protein